ncbi:MAG: PEGA domain-containing protein [Pirellula sp.]|nr:PEGA domain-containing protein [Pirellula sp.]
MAPYGICVAMLLATSLGCVRKRLTFRTNPAGAMVYVDKQPIGLTPVSTNFTYYGTRSIEIVKDGYRTEKFLRKIHPPWYEVPPLDFVSETLWPFEHRDERIIDVQMSPELPIPNEALIASGEQLRLQASQGIAVTPPPPAAGGLTPILVPANPEVLPNPAMTVPPPGMLPAPTSSGPSWTPGSWLQGIFFPNGEPLSVPSTQVMPGGGFRPPSE